MNHSLKRNLPEVLATPRSFGHTCYIAALGLSIGFSVPLLAASTAETVGSASDATDNGQLEEIVVTAQKRSELINDVPMSITALTGAELSNLGITDTADLRKAVPGFTYQQSNYGVPIYGIRGVSFFDTSATANPAVSVYVDQVPIPYSALTKGASLDVARVEVLKGPQGTLFGENSTGGAVNYIPTKPTDVLEAGADLSYGRFNAVDFNGYVSGPVGETLKVRVAVRTNQQGDWQYSTSGNDTAGQRNLNIGRLIADWDPQPGLQVELNVNGYVDRSDTQQAQFQRYLPTAQGPTARSNPGLTALATLAPTPRDARAAEWTPGLDLAQDDKFFQPSLRVDWNLAANVTFTSLSSYIDYRGSQPTDAAGVAYDDYNVDQRQKFDIYNQELRLSGSQGPWKWLGGVNYEHDRLNEVLDIATMGSNTRIGPNNFSNLTASNDQSVDTKAAFGSLDYDVTEAISANASARYTDQRRSFVGCESGGGNTPAEYNAIYNTLGLLSATPLIPGSCISFNTGPFPLYTPAGAVHSAINQDNVSWRTGVKWTLLPKTMVYFNVSKGFKAGDFSTQPIVFATQVVSVSQESVLAYELGFKSTLANGALQINGAAFYYDYRDKQIDGYVTIPIFGNFPALVNVPESSIRGGELDLTWKPIADLRLSANGTYLSSRVDSSYIGGTPIPGLSTNFKDEALPNTPTWQSTGDAEYSLPISDRLHAYIGGSVSYRSHAYAVFGETPGFDMPGYTLLDLRAGVTSSGGWGIQIFGRNVTNTFYVTNTAHEIDTVTRYAGMPATYGAKFSYTF